LLFLVESNRVRAASRHLHPLRRKGVGRGCVILDPNAINIRHRIYGPEH
jgi:hypothetical protein